MRAEVIQCRCEYSQEYGRTYAALEVTADGKWPVLLQLPKWQYNAEKTPKILQEIADRVNSGGADRLSGPVEILPKIP